MLVGVDIGGTKIAIGEISQKKVIRKIKVDTAKSKKSIWNSITKAIIEIRGDKKIERIGMAIAGSIDHTKGIIVYSPNMRFLDNWSIARELKMYFNCEVVIDNDVNCMALGESLFWKRNNLLVLALGTGVGGGIVIEGKIYRGQGFGAELGHIVIDYHGLKCSCGNHGCLEEYVSGRGIRRLGRVYLKRTIEPLAIQRLAEKGDRNALKVYQKVGRYLGVAVASYVNIFNPKLIVISGSIRKASNLFMDDMLSEVRQRAFKTNLSRTKIVVSKIGGNAALVGAVSSST